MDEARLQRLLEEVASGEVHPDDAAAQLRRLPFADLGFARVDHHRALRQGVAETVYGPGKDPAHVAAIVARYNAELGAGGVITVDRRAWFNPNLESRWQLMPALIAALSMLQTLLIAALSVAR